MYLQIQKQCLLQQYLPFTVLKPFYNFSIIFSFFVATVLTVYGIETRYILRWFSHACSRLQQYLPFTVLKPPKRTWTCSSMPACCNSTYRLRYWNSLKSNNILYMSVATVLTVYGIETLRLSRLYGTHRRPVATVLTVYGIETRYKVL